MNGTVDPLTDATASLNLTNNASLADRRQGRSDRTLRRQPDGPVVSGPARDLAHAMWGREEAVDSLTGDGIATLTTRLG